MTMEINVKDEIVMKLLHYFITEKIIIQLFFMEHKMKYG